MSNRKRFEFEFEDRDPQTFIIDYAGERDHKAVTQVEHGVPVLYVNRQACAFLARIFARLALGSYDGGYHLHFGKNFNPDSLETLRIVLEPRDS